MPNHPVRTVIFDLGGVLSLSGRPVDLIRRFPDHDPDEVIKVMMGDYGSDSDHPWHRLERGEISMDEYRTGIGQLVAAAGLRMRPPSEEEAAQRPGSTFEFVRSEAMHELVVDLRAAGCRTGVLTNNIREFRDRWRLLMNFDELFDTVVDDVITTGSTLRAAAHALESSGWSDVVVAACASTPDDRRSVQASPVSRRTVVIADD